MAKRAAVIDYGSRRRKGASIASSIVPSQDQPSLLYPDEPVSQQRPLSEQYVDRDVNDEEQSAAGSSFLSDYGLAFERDGSSGGGLFKKRFGSLPRRSSIVSVGSNGSNSDAQTGRGRSLSESRSDAPLERYDSPATSARASIGRQASTARSVSSIVSPVSPTPPTLPSSPGGATKQGKRKSKRSKILRDMTSAAIMPDSADLRGEPRRAASYGSNGAGGVEEFDDVRSIHSSHSRSSLGRRSRRLSDVPLPQSQLLAPQFNKRWSSTIPIAPPAASVRSDDGSEGRGTSTRSPPSSNSSIKGTSAPAAQRRGGHISARAAAYDERQAGNSDWQDEDEYDEERGEEEDDHEVEPMSPKYPARSFGSGGGGASSSSSSSKGNSNGEASTNGVHHANDRWAAEERKPIGGRVAVILEEEQERIDLRGADVASIFSQASYEEGNSSGGRRASEATTSMLSDISDVPELDTGDSDTASGSGKVSGTEATSVTSNDTAKRGDLTPHLEEDEDEDEGTADEHKKPELLVNGAKPHPQGQPEHEGEHAEEDEDEDEEEEDSEDETSDEESDDEEESEDEEPAEQHQQQSTDMGRGESQDKADTESVYEMFAPMFRNGALPAADASIDVAKQEKAAATRQVAASQLRQRKLKEEFTKLQSEDRAKERAKRERAVLEAGWDSLEVERYLNNFGKHVAEVRSAGPLDTSPAGAEWPSKDEWVPAGASPINYVPFAFAYLGAAISYLSPRHFIDLQALTSKERRGAKGAFARGEDEADRAFRLRALKSNSERFYLSAVPMWEQVLSSARSIAVWEDKLRSLLCATAYFSAWYRGLLLPCLFGGLALLMLKLRFAPPRPEALRRVLEAQERRYQEVEQTKRSGIAKVLHEAEAPASGEKLEGSGDDYDLAAEAAARYGNQAIATLGYLADVHEKARNLWMFRSPPASTRALALLILTALASIFVTPWALVRLPGLAIGLATFVIVPIREHYPGVLGAEVSNLVDFFLAGVPNDAQYAMEVLRRRAAAGEALTGDPTFDLDGVSGANKAAQQQQQAARLNSYPCALEGKAGVLRIDAGRLIFASAPIPAGKGPGARKAVPAQVLVNIQLEAIRAIRKFESGASSSRSAKDGASPSPSSHSASAAASASASAPLSLRITVGGGKTHQFDRFAGAEEAFNKIVALAPTRWVSN